MGFEPTTCGLPKPLFSTELSRHPPAAGIAPADVPSISRIKRTCKALNQSDEWSASCRDGYAAPSSLAGAATYRLRSPATYAAVRIRRMPMMLSCDSPLASRGRCLRRRGTGRARRGFRRAHPRQSGAGRHPCRRSRGVKGHQLQVRGAALAEDGIEVVGAADLGYTQHAWPDAPGAGGEEDASDGRDARVGAHRILPIELVRDEVGRRRAADARGRPKYPRWRSRRRWQGGLRLIISRCRAPMCGTENAPSPRAGPQPSPS